MNNTPAPFTSIRQYIDEQLQDIILKLKDMDATESNNLSIIYKDSRRTLRSIEKYHAELKFMVFTALVEYEPSVIYAFADTHLSHEMLGLKILEIAEGLLSSESLTERATGIAALIHHFNKYSILIHENLYREEATLLPLLKRYHKTEELQAMQLQVENKLLYKFSNKQVEEQII